MVAGVGSGVGKTTVSLGLMAAFRRRGLRVQPFKVGPDFIDPGLHALATGGPSRNLDGWMCPRGYVTDLFRRLAREADVAVIEGVMGLFDGYDPRSDAGSTAEVARWVEAPVILVVDAWGLARSAAAVLSGYAGFDRRVPVTGVIFNRTGGEGHYRLLCEAIASSRLRVKPVGHLPRRADLAMPERHLGLHTAVEGHLGPDFFARLADAVETGIDLDAVRDLARSPGRIGASAPDIHRIPHQSVRVRIGVARDEAFQFYYEDNFEALRTAGADLVFFSPLRDRSLPVDLGGLYLGGGYPELYAGKLSRNESMLRDLRAFAEAGRPIYAECGGLMMLCREIEDLDGRRHPVAGLLPVAAYLRRDGVVLRYTEVETVRPTLLGPPGTKLRGHEFHASVIDEPPAAIDRAYELRSRRRDSVGREGYSRGSLLASYVHLHFGPHPAVAASVVRACTNQGEV